MFSYKLINMRLQLESIWSFRFLTCRTQNYARFVRIRGKTKVPTKKIMASQYERIFGWKLKRRKIGSWTLRVCWNCWNSQQDWQQVHTHNQCLMELCLSMSWLNLCCYTNLSNSYFYLWKWKIWTVSQFLSFLDHIAIDKIQRRTTQRCF